MKIRATKLHYMALLVIGTLPATSSAQLLGCPNVVSNNDRKVVLDAIYLSTSASGPSASLPTQRLRAKLQEQLSQLNADIDVPTTVVECKRRKPSDPSDFTEAQVRTFNSNRVVLEMWGTLSGKPSKSTVNATVGYAVVPLRYYEYFKASAPGTRIPGVYFADYTVRTEKLESLVDQSNELKIYASVGLGLKMLKEESFDEAKKSFCRASALLRPAAGKTLDQDHKDLQQYVDRMTGVTVDNALGSSSYNGPLKRIDPKIARECA
jgi:hypothetical protein